MEAYAGKQFVGIDLHRRRSVIVRTTDCGGWTVLERLQQGEGAKAVARILRTSRRSDAG